MPLLVGVDAGATTTVVLADDGLAQRTLIAGPANVRLAGVASAAQTITRAVSDVANGTPLDVLVVGAAGAGTPHLADALAHALRAQFPEAKVRVVDDATIALRAAVADGDGIVLIAGTGSIACARIGDATFRVGGYGQLLGDEGSAFAIGAAAVRLLLRTFDGRASRDPFLDAIAQRLSAETAQDVVTRVTDAPYAVGVLAELAPIVLEHASAGERSANKIVQTAALDLFDLVRAVVRLAEIGERDVPLVFAGGLLRANSLLSYLLETRIAHDLPTLHPCKQPPTPPHGALALARRLIS